ncbi:unnamed protein product [Paramecium primaurelia]|uniref:Ethanolaminephosphotransferase n=1 Tax=Paramecium primaurelia TaxID=5886 RepID=A0A8S1K042_PARPR|nr:unnamed protein product [Paramecium primaurelia]
MNLLNYDFIAQENLKFLKTYKYKGTDQSLLYNYVLSPFANWCLKYVPLNVAPNTLTLLGLICIIICHILFYFVMGDNFQGTIPDWLLWTTFILHMIYMNFDNLDGKQARRTHNSSPLGMILDHNFDSMIIAIQGTNFVTCLQCGQSLLAFLLICVPTYPFYIIAHEEYYTHEMNLPIINAAAEGTVFVGSLFAINAIFGCEFWTQKIPQFYNLQFNTVAIIMFFFVVAFGLPFVFKKITKFVPLSKALKSQRYMLFIGLVLFYVILFSPSDVGSRHMRAILYIFGFTMSKAVGIVAVYHVSNQELPNYLNSIYLFCVLLFNTIYGQIFGNCLIEEGLLLQITALITVLVHIHFLYNITRQISEALKIKVFKINK